ncbi:hypothetical protein [Nocardia sp. NPDC049149]|uniref:hypothetical protein n=1 Tax=Nocardia sp. NPDC049149 TaxID=3364315 RepID=UPI00371DEA2D
MIVVLLIAVASGVVVAALTVLVLRRRRRTADITPSMRLQQSGSVLSTQLSSFSPRNRQRRKKKDFADKTMGGAGTDSSGYGGSDLGGGGAGCGGGGL